MLITAVEHAGPDLPFAERMHRLLAGSEGDIAAFSDTGALIAAGPAAARLNGRNPFTTFRPKPTNTPPAADHIRERRARRHQPGVMETGASGLALNRCDQLINGRQTS